LFSKARWASKSKATEAGLEGSPHIDAAKAELLSYSGGLRDAMLHRVAMNMLGVMT
jgi:hypothetical protein